MSENQMVIPDYIGFETLRECENTLVSVTDLEERAFYVKGKAWFNIKEGINKSLPGFEGYSSFKEYCNVSSLGDKHSLRLIQAYVTAEELKKAGVPEINIPKTEGAMRKLTKLNSDKVGIIDKSMAIKAIAEGVKIDDVYNEYLAPPRKTAEEIDAENYKKDRKLSIDKHYKLCIESVDMLERHTKILSDYYNSGANMKGNLHDVYMLAISRLINMLEGFKNEG